MWTWQVAWRSAWRKPLRSGLLLAGAALCAGIFYFSNWFWHSALWSLERGSERIGADIAVVPRGVGARAVSELTAGSVWPGRYLPASAWSCALAAPGVNRAARQLYVRTFDGVCCQVSGQFPVIAIDPQHDFTLQGLLGSGRALSTQGVILGADVGDKAAAYHLRFKASNERVTLFGHVFAVTSVLARTGTAIDQAIYMDRRALARLNLQPGVQSRIKPNAASVIFIQTRRDALYETTRYLSRQLPLVDVVTLGGEAQRMRQWIAPLRVLSASVTVALVLAAVVQMGAFFSATVSERTRELGAMRALGGGGFAIYRLFAKEAFLLSGLGSVVGVAVASIFLYDNQVYLRHWLTLPVQFPPLSEELRLLFSGVAIVVVSAQAAALLSLRRALRQDVYGLLREGE